MQCQLFLGIAPIELGGDLVSALPSLSVKIRLVGVRVIALY